MYVPHCHVPFDEPFFIENDCRSAPANGAKANSRELRRSTPILAVPSSQPEYVFEASTTPLGPTGEMSQTQRQPVPSRSQGSLCVAGAPWTVMPTFVLTPRDAALF